MIVPSTSSGVGTVGEYGMYVTNSVEMRGSGRVSRMRRVYASWIGCCADARDAQMQAMAAAAARMVHRVLTVLIVMPLFVAGCDVAPEAARAARPPGAAAGCSSIPFPRGGRGLCR